MIRTLLGIIVGYALVFMSMVLIGIIGAPFVAWWAFNDYVLHRRH